MSDDTRRPAIAGRCAVRSIAHAAHALGCIAFGEVKAAALHGAAATAWMGVAVSTKAAYRAGVSEWMLDSIDAGVDDSWLAAGDDE